MTISLRMAEEADLPAIVAVMNAAFRGDAEERGWSVESGYISGDRTSVPLLREEIAGGARYLFARDEATLDVQGCVSLQAIAPERWYLGSLTVAPALQNTGFGRKLLRAAEEFAADRGARSIEMTVVNVRDALIAWYERRGYRLTGETRPFPYGDNRYGRPMRTDLKFVVLERQVGA